MLSGKQLTHLIGDAYGDLLHARSVGEQLKVIGNHVAAQTVPAGLADGLPKGSRQFVIDWNRYLGDAEKAVTGLRGVTALILVFTRDFGALASRAKAVKASGSLAPYKTALRRVQLDLRRIDDLQLSAVKPLNYSTHMAAITRLKRSNQDARAIYERVAHQYPSGVILPNGYLFTPHNINT